MKVKLATNVLSHSVAAGLHFMVATNALPPDALATAAYCQRMNDIFDVLNSTYSKDPVVLRRPLHQASKTVEFISSSKE